MTASIDPVRVMLSSRNRDLIPSGRRAVPIETVRREVQAELESALFCGHELLEIWINETAGAGDATVDAWDECMRKVARADVLVVVYNGEAGWVREPGGIGICHAEMQAAYELAPSKLRLVELQFASNRYDPARLEAACGRALTAGARSYRHVAAILKRGLDRVPPGAPPAAASRRPREHPGPRLLPLKERPMRPAQPKPRRCPWVGQVLPRPARASPGR